MSIALMTAAWALDLPTGEKIVLLSLADNANDSGHCWPSMAMIAKRAGMTTRGAQLIIQRLEAAGHIHREQIPGKGCNYYIHPAGPPERSSPRTTFAPNETTPTPERRSDKSSGTTSKKVQATPSPSRVSAAVAFELFWDAYPRKVAKHAARKAWLKAAKRDGAARIQAGVERYVLHPPDDPQFIPHPTTWLNRGSYDDQIEETQYARRDGPLRGAGQAGQPRGGAPTPRVSAALRLVAEERARADAY